MDSRRTSDLIHGHLGRSIYDSEQKCWRFAREPGRRTVLQCLGHHDILVPAGKHFDGPSRGIEYGVQRLLKTHPEIMPGMNLLPPLAHVSEAIMRVTSRHDPTVGNRLVLGAARDLDNKRSRNTGVPIVATVAGDASDSVRLFSIQDRHLAWEEYGRHHTVRLSVPHLDAREGSSWIGTNGPVQQLCFARSRERLGSWLAVRQLDSTTVLRPLYSRAPLGEAFNSNRKSKSFSNIDPNPVVTIPISRTGGASHADVSFNPWYHRQVSILDQRGQWSVWNIEGHRLGGAAYEARLDSTGCVDDSIATGKVKCIDDGWGSICWAGDLYTLLVFTRRHMAILNLRNRPATRLQASDLGLAGTSAWILDVQRSPVNDSHLFVVTSSRIFWLEAVAEGEGNSGSDALSGCKRLLSWGHSRHEQDTSLQLSVVDRQGCAFLLLYSRLSGLTTVFQFGFSADDPSLPISTSDPYKLHFPSSMWQRETIALGAQSESQTRHLSSALLLPARYVRRANNEPTGPGYLYEQHEVEFYALLVLANDLSLHRCLYTSGVPPGGWKGRNRQRFKAVKRPNALIADVRRRGRRHELISDERFIVEDGVLGSSEVEEQTSSAGHRGARSKDAPEGQVLPNRDAAVWTLPWEWLYELAFLEDKVGPDAQDGSQAVTVSHDETCRSLLVLEERISTKEASSRRPIQTLLELLGESPRVTDLDAASSYLANLMRSLTVNTTNSGNENASSLKPIFKHLAWPPLLDDATSLASDRIATDDSMSTIYYRLCQEWVDPIREKVSAGYLAANDSILRRVAAELYLASTGVALTPSKENAARQASLPYGTNIMPAREPVPEVAKKPSIASSPIQRLAYRPAPQSQPSNLNSTQLSRTQSSLDLPRAVTEQPAEPEPEEDDGPLTRLRAYTSIKPQQPRPQPPAISNLLAHWTLGADPASYSWEASIHAINTTNTQQDDPSHLLPGSKHSTSAAAKRRRRDAHRSVADDRERAGQMPQASQPVFYSSQLHLHRDEDVDRPPGIQISKERGGRGDVGGGIEEDGAGRGLGGGDDDVNIPMTQTEPGAFGSRRVTHGFYSPGPGIGLGPAGEPGTSVRKKGKKRAAGF